jgi:hypothetical protein
VTWGKTVESGYLRLYYNGAAVETPYNVEESMTGSIPNGDLDLYIGSNNAPGEFFSGWIDEVRISNKARDACWIGTSYSNQNTPSNFHTLGTEAPPPTAIILSSFTAAEHEEGVLLEWRTGFEANNLGFNIYREEGGQLYRLTSEPIKGSALMTGPGTRTAGYSYTWWDTSVQLSALSSQLSASKYWLEDIDLSGAKTLHGPVTPVFSHKPAPKKAQSILLSQINKQGAGIRSKESGVRNQKSGVRGQESDLRTQDLTSSGQRSAVSSPRSAVPAPI